MRETAFLEKRLKREACNAFLSQIRRARDILNSMEKVSFLSIKRARHFIIAASVLVLIPLVLSYYVGLTGKVIVSTSKTRLDPYFAKTVIYIFDHSYRGAFGLVLNQEPPEFQKKKYNLDKMWPDVSLMRGGPVLFPEYEFVIENRKKALTHWRTLPVRVSTYDAAKHEDVDTVYLGVSSWGMSQLEREVKATVWDVYECNVWALLTLHNHINLWNSFQNEEIGNICTKEKDE